MSSDTGDRDVPLCVDLDGTLIHGDVFRSSVGRLLRANPWRAFLLLGWMLKGRPRVKMRAAELAPVRPAELRYNRALLALLRREREQGRRLLLVTGALLAEAEKVAAHVGVFDDVVGTSEGCNLTGRRKAKEMVDRFGERGFDYVGNSFTDLPVWRHARRAWVVSGRRRLHEAARNAAQVERVLQWS